MTQLAVTKFATGAVRDKTDVPVRWDLLSVVALQAIASSTEIPTLECRRPWLNYVGDAANHLLTYIGGKRDRPYLELAWWSLAHGCDLHELGDTELSNRADICHDFPIEPGNLALLSHRALRHLASTCAEGCGKYGEWNWLYGFPLVSVISHALDHIWAITDANTTEDHWGHALWNVMVAIHNERMRPDLCTNLLGDWFQLTDEIKQTLDKQREERARHELGRDTVRGTGANNQVRRSVSDDNAPGDEWEGVAPNADGSTALGRAIEEARGGPAPNSLGERYA